MRYFIYVFFILCAVVLNVALFPMFAIHGAIPQLVLIVATICAVTIDDIAIAFLVCCVGGFVWEIYTGALPGSWQISYFISTWLVFLLSRRVFFVQDRVKYLVVFLAVAQLVSASLFVIIHWYATHLHVPTATPVFQQVVHRLGFAFIYNVVMLYPLYVVLNQIDHIVEVTLRKRRTLT